MIEESLDKIDEQLNDLKGKKEPNILVDLIVDRSSSMYHQTKDVIKGINEYLDGLRQDKENRILVSLTLFDDQIETPYVLTPIAEVPVLDDSVYFPRGCTALNDAVGITLNRLERHIREYKEEPKVLVVILTDGLNNVTREFKAGEIQKKISDLDREKDNYTIVYLGSHADAWAVGQSLGISGGSSMSFDQNNLVGTMRGMSTATSNYARSREKSAQSFYMCASDTFEKEGVTVADDVKGKLDKIENK